MGAVRDELDKKLDMSLEDLASKGPRRNDRSRSPHRNYKGDGKYGGSRDSGHRDWGGRDSGKGKGKRRIAPEEKALMKTRCFFNADSDLIVQLYDTEIVILKSKLANADSEKPGPETTANPGADDPAKTESNGIDVDKAKESEPDCVKKSDADQDGKSDNNDKEATGAETEKKADGDNDKKPEVDSEQKAEVADTDKKPTDESEGKATVADGNTVEAGDAKPQDDKVESAEKVEDKPATSGSTSAVLVLNSGKFRTIETRYIINEALNPLSLRVLEANSQSWTVSGASMEKEQPFEDNMEIPLKAADSAAVKQHLEDKIQKCKDRDRERHNRDRGDHRQHRDFRAAPPPGWQPGMPPPPGQHHYPPPAGYAMHGHPPPGWGGAPPHHGPPPLYGGAAHHRPAPYGAPAPVARPTGPLPDSMFQ